MPDDSAIAHAAHRLREARRVVVLTGAGVSAESGLRTFRGGTTATAADLPKDMQALWKEFDPTTLATPEAFEANPEMVTRWYDWRRLGCLAAEPNAGHRALAEIERRLISPARGGEFTLLTQNVDRLHHRAGSRNVVELHGTILKWRCTQTGREIEPPPEPMPAFPPPSPFAPGALLRPNVVWFGEALPRHALETAHRVSCACDVFMTIGTSSVVWPAAGFVELAASHGAFCIEINAEATPASRVVDVALRGKSGDVLPRLVAAAWGESCPD